MSGPKSCGVLQQDLEPLERTVVEELKSWLATNPNAEWKPSPRFSLVEQCSETKLRQILQQLAQVCLYLLSKARFMAENYRILASLPFGLHTQGGKSRRGNSSQYSPARVVKLEMGIENIL
jgi:hypothetical protein